MQHGTSSTVIGGARLVLRSQAGTLSQTRHGPLRKKHRVQQYAPLVLGRSNPEPPIRVQLRSRASKGLWSSRRSNKVRAAVSPIFPRDWRRVVRVGLLCRAFLSSFGKSDAVGHHLQSHNLSFLPASLLLCCHSY